MRKSGRLHAHAATFCTAGGARFSLKSLDNPIYTCWILISLDNSAAPRDIKNIMGQELSTTVELDAPDYGPKMAALAPLQRKLVNVYLEHPTWSATAMALEAGYSQSSAQVRGSINLRDPRVIAAINEEGDRRFKTGGPLAVMGLLAMVMNPAHKDHFRACVAVADRTGYHAMSEHKVTVDDKRPQTKQELIAAVKGIAAELNLTPEMIEKLTGEKIIEGEYSEVSDVEADIAAQMEDL